QLQTGELPWAPFSSQKEWELAEWLVQSGVSQSNIDKLLKLQWTKEHTEPLSFKNKDEFFKKIDSLPSRPEWKCTEITVTGDLCDDMGKPLTEELEIWMRNPVELVEELIGNPSFRNSLHYKPVRIHNRRTRKRVFSEAWTADWWWTAQLNSTKPGATVAPVILASDKTKFSYFSGDKAAWPVYLTIGNISKRVRRKTSKRAVLLLGYLPVAKLHCWSDSKRKAIGHDLFHACMRRFVEPLVTAGKQGVNMHCADKKTRRVHPLLSAYIADHPERSLAACVKANRCAPCPVQADGQGDLPRDRYGRRVVSVLRDPESAKKTIHKAFGGDDEAQTEADLDGLQIVNKPFWADLPFSNIFMAFPPDILHQLHKGIFKDHLFSWCQTIMGEKEMDKRYISMPSHPSLRHFKHGISKVSQWTGNEYKQMEKVFLGAIAGAVPRQTFQAAKALLDFIYLAQQPSLDEDDLSKLDKLLETFHQLKDKGAFADVRDHFNIPKLHALIHYTALIHLHGTPDGYNTETPERLHIDYAKSGYRASNKKDYTKQMTTFMSRMEAVTIRHELIRLHQPDLDENPQMEIDDPQDLSESSEPAEPQTVQVQRSVITFARISPLPSVPIATIEQNFGVKDFLPVLEEYLERTLHSQPDFEYLQPTYHDRFLVFKKIGIHLASVTEPGTLWMDVVRATAPKKPGILQSLKKDPCFDTVLVRQVTGKHLIGPPRPARVRMLFKLPATILQDNAAWNSQPLLAYIEWFKPFKQSSGDIAPGLYYTSPSFDRHHMWEVSIIPADAIVRSCHLLPYYGKKSNHWWSSSNVLDNCDKLLLNAHLDVH
ncbi:hypothetical protein M407DRAFT_51577, partial [Tulasnella calospora MUT 4182]